MILSRQSTPWAMASLLAIWAVAFFPIVPEMVDTWFGHSDNSHGVLVPIISLYFLWTKKEKIAQTPIQGSGWGLALLLFSALFYVVSFVGGIAFFTRLALVISLIGAVWACLGTRMLRCVSFPLCFLFFMIPVPDTLLGMVAFPLQLVATKISADMIQMCQIPVYREGNMLFFVQTQLEVAEACSGIRSIMSLSILSVVFAYISTGNWWRKAVLVLSAIPVALVANILRITATGILAHFFGDRVARGFLHEFSGIVVFFFGMVIIFGIYVLLGRIGGEK